jgi:hypothetical protein
VSLFGAIQWVSDPDIAEGEISLYRDGKLVWHGSLEEPFDDADMDRMHLNPRDWERLKRAVIRHNQTHHKST